MSPSRRAVLAIVAVALLPLAVPPGFMVLAGLAVLAATAVDAGLTRRRPQIRREAPTLTSRGRPSDLQVEVDARPGCAARVRQPVPPELALDPSESAQRLDAQLMPLRRGRHVLPPAVVRVTGPLGLARWDHHGDASGEISVYPDLPGAYRLAGAVRRGRFRDEGRRSRGPLGLGTDFESVRDYSPDDDIRQVNWRATARMQRPMSNQYRVDQDRDVVCVVDVGRLMSAPLGTSSRLDIALDALVAVAAVADEVGDRCGVIAFDSEVRRQVRPRRDGGRQVIEAVFDLEPSALDSDYQLAFERAGGKRACVLVFTDLTEEAAARPLIEAMPVLTRRHAVIVASSTDSDLAGIVRAAPHRPLDVYAAAVAIDVLDARARAAAHLARSGADVLEAEPERLAAACVGAYLRMKARARL